MAIKYFDIKRMVYLPGAAYICFDDIVGVNCAGRMVLEVFTTGGRFTANMPLEDFEAEVERAVKQTISDQNQNLEEFNNELKHKLAELNANTLLNKTDKISDAN